MGEHATSRLSKALLPLTLLSIVLYAVGLGNPHWLKASFQLPAAVLVPGAPAGMMIPLDANMGLFESCSNAHLPTGGVHSDCSSEGASDWQWVAAGFAIFGLVMSVLSLVGMVLVVLVSKTRGNKKIQTLVAVMHFFTAGGFTVSLILYGLNRSFQVAPPLPIFITFNISWAFIVSAVSVAAFLFLFVLNIIDIITRPFNSVDVTTGENNSVNYSANTASVSVIGRRS